MSGPRAWWYKNEVCSSKKPQEEEEKKRVTIEADGSCPRSHGEISSTEKDWMYFIQKGCEGGDSWWSTVPEKMRSYRDQEGELTLNTRKTSILSGEERKTMGPCRKGGRSSNECVVDGLNFLRAMQYKDAPNQERRKLKEEAWGFRESLKGLEPHVVKWKKKLALGM